jgi:hypothetical protein
MRKRHSSMVLALLITALSYGQSQNSFPPSGNVGIGTKNPTSALQIVTGDLKVDNGVLTLGIPTPFAANYNLVTNKGIMLRSATPPIEGIPLTIINSGGFTTLAVAQCNGCFSNIALKGDSVITGGTAASVGGGSVIIANENNGNIKFETGLQNSTAKTQMTIDKTGKVGIGTETPTVPLQVKGGTNDSDLMIVSNTTGLNKFTVSTAGFKYTDNFGDQFSFGTTSGAVGNIFSLPASTHFLLGETFSAPGTGGYAMYINGGNTRFTKDTFLDGKVMLTGAPPTTGAASFPYPVFPATAGTVSLTNYKLYVKGGILAQEMRVATTWADYVFANNYKLTPLNEVERFIKANGHLSNMPSGKEVAQSGIEVGEMTKMQQEKIEELTLYLIQQNKAIELLKKENEALKALSERLSKLEAKLLK